MINLVPVKHQYVCVIVSVSCATVQLPMVKPQRAYFFVCLLNPKCSHTFCYTSLHVMCFTWKEKKGPSTVATGFIHRKIVLNFIFIWNRFLSGRNFPHWKIFIVLWNTESFVKLVEQHHPSTQPAPAYSMCGFKMTSVSWHGTWQLNL